jgi:hypothetical protein
MDIQTIISVLGLLGIGGIIGSYLQHLWNRKRETESRIQNLNENKYRSTLVFMRCVLKPENVEQFNIEDPNIQKLRNTNEIKEYAKTKLIEYYYNSILYASDEVLRKIKQFIDSPSESNFMKTAIAMREDLWKKKTKSDLKTLSLE